MEDALVQGAVTGYAIALPVGAVAAYLVGLTARTSLSVGCAAALGVATTDGLYALAAAVGGSALSQTIEPVAGPLRVVAGLVLGVLAATGLVRAWRTYRYSPSTATSEPRPSLGPRRAYLSLIVLTAVNPSTVIYFSAVVVGTPELSGTSIPDRAAFAAAAFAASASWQLVLVSGGAAIGQVLAGRTGGLTTAVVSSAVIILLALRMVLA